MPQAWAWAAAGGDDDGDRNSEVVLSIPDPVQPVAVDPTIGGVFAGEAGNPPADIEPGTTAPITYLDRDSNALAQGEIDAAPTFDIDDFAAAFDSVSAAQPTLSTSSIEFARAIMARLAGVGTRAGATAEPDVQTAASVFDMFADLTPAERALVLRNPVKAYKSRTAANDAVAATGALFTGSAYLTRADAFRHGYWNWLMSKCCTVEWATAFATAHESEVPNNDDKRMDLNNNMVGRRLYASAPQSTHEAAQAALLDYKLLWINSRLKNVTVGVDYLVYLQPLQSMTFFDDGPEYDDIYTLAIAGKVVGETPAGGSKAFEFDQLVSGEHAADIHCKLDGTKGGCGFQIRLTGALRLPSGEASTQQIVIQETGSHATRLMFPTMKTAKTD